MNKERVIILLLACINFTHIMDFMIMMPLGPQLMRIFHIDTQQFGFLVAAYTITAGISSFIAAFFVDKYDRKFILSLGYIGFVLGTLACAISPTFETLLLARIIAGAFGGLIAAQVMSIIGDLIPFERRGRAMGTISMAFSVASIAGVPFSLYVAAEMSWHAPFIFIGGVGALLIPFILYYIPSMTSHIERSVKTSPFAVAIDVIKDNNQQRGLLLAVLLMIGHFSIIPFLSPYMVGNVGFTEHDLAYIYFVGGILTLFSSPFVGKMSDKFGKFEVFALMSILAIVPIFIITNLPPVPIYVALMATAFFFVAASGRFIPSNAIITSVVPPQKRGSYMSIVSAMQQLASGIASFVGGIIVIKTSSGALLNYHYVGYIAILVSLSCIWVARIVKPLEQKEVKESIVA